MKINIGTDFKIVRQNPFIQKSSELLGPNLKIDL